MCVLKLTLGKKKFCKFFSIFSFSVWSVRTDLAWSPDACGPADGWSSSVSFGRVSIMSGLEPYRYKSIAFSHKPQHTISIFQFFLSSCAFFLSRFHMRFRLFVSFLAFYHLIPSTFTVPLVLLKFSCLLEFWNIVEIVCMIYLFCCLLGLDLTYLLLDCYVFICIFFGGIQSTAVIMPNFF